MKRILLTAISFFIFAGILTASLNETLPTWHWAYEYIHELQVRGEFTDLLAFNKPYKRGDIAKILVRITNRSDTKNNPFQYLIEPLLKEFQEEIEEIQSTMHSESIQLGAHLKCDLDKPEGVKAKYRGVYRSRVNVPVGKSVTIHNGMIFDQYLVDDPEYIGKKWRGMAAYTEQAYIIFSRGRFDIKFGRDFLKWGMGKSGTLLFSNMARPLDQFLGKFRAGPFRYSFLASSLDDQYGAGSDTTQTDGLMKRYISAHRLEASFFHDKLQCAITEAVVYGGKDRQPDWVYLNPFIFYHGAQNNVSGSANTLGTLDILAYPFSNWECYGSLLIDDIQVEKTGPGDLEPNEIGLILGTRYADPFHLSGTTVGAEYALVTNRTYKTPNPWETFIHRNKPLGHPLGNDFDLWRLDVTQWFSGSLRFNLAYSAIRKGEGSIDTPWDAPWFDYTVEEGYSEPFPTGIVEKRNQFEFSVHYYPSIHWGVEGYFQSAQRSNADHIRGNDQTETSWRIGVWWDGEISWKF